MRKFNYCSIEASSYAKNMLACTNDVLVMNFNKVAKWIKENCPSLNGEFNVSHNPYYWLKLVVENGFAYLEEGSHGEKYSTALSATETATFVRGSMQSVPNAYCAQFFRNDRLEEFLKEWHSIKSKVVAEYKSQRNVYSPNFEP
jgi:hypothetical protein